MVLLPGLLMPLSAAYLFEVALGRYSSGLISEWGPSDDAAASLTDHPDAWTDGSLVLDRVTGVSSSGAGFFAHQSEECWGGGRWGHVDGIRADDGFFAHQAEGFWRGCR